MQTFTRILTIIIEKKFNRICAENAHEQKNILALQKCKGEIEMMLGVSK